MNAAAIDLGTNSIKLLIVQRDKDGHMHVLFRHRAVVRLGEGTFKKKGVISIPREVQLRTLKVFQSYAQFLEAYNVDIVRATGTSALRDAKNGPDFVREVRGKTGIALEVLPAEEEARLIVKGVASELTLPRKPVLFIDIGGGSCELTLVNGKRIEKISSLPLGAVRLTELFNLKKSKPDAAQLRRLDTHIKKVLKDAWPNPKHIKVAFGSAGTIRALARLVSKTELSDDDRLIKRRQLDRVSVAVARMSTKRIAALPGIDAKRAEILHAGTQVLAAVFAYFHIDSLKVSNRGLREGLLLDLFDRPHKPSSISAGPKDGERLEHLSQLGRKYHSNKPHCFHVWHLARLLFDELAAVHGLADDTKPVLMAACILHDVGKFINESSKHKHSYYILKNTEIPSFNERDRLLIASLARYHRKSPPRVGHEGYDLLNPDEKKLIQGLASVLRIADALDAAHDQGVRWIKCQWGPGKVHIYCEMKPGSQIDQVVFREKVRYFEELFKVQVSVGLISEMKTAKTLSPATAPARLGTASKA